MERQAALESTSRGVKAQLQQLFTIGRGEAGLEVGLEVGRVVSVSHRSKVLGRVQSKLDGIQGTIDAGDGIGAEDGS